MELRFRNSFFRDLNSVGSRETSRAIQLLINKIAKAKSPSSVPGMKRLKHTTRFEYKIELKVQRKIYWILCDSQSDTIEFIRIKSEVWCKKQLG